MRSIAMMAVLSLVGAACGVQADQQTEVLPEAEQTGGDGDLVTAERTENGEAVGEARRISASSRPSTATPASADSPACNGARRLASRARPVFRIQRNQTLATGICRSAGRQLVAGGAGITTIPTATSACSSESWSAGFLRGAATKGGALDGARSGRARRPL